uniref:Complex 1 LYR protein domain-containing protein n=1 Tax=Neolamprologus brichardi TaxID=32507 RepID=A0A3Q4HJ80_NEOBR
MAANSRTRRWSSEAHAMNETKLCVCVCYRNYALRRVRDAFKANRNVEDPKAVERLMEEGWQTLALIQRQQTVTKLSETQRKFFSCLSASFSGRFQRA